jgi:lipid II:glycine glycyltransferase (peptidoglycan interpeptide bridge formation enzyme)
MLSFAERQKLRFETHCDVQNFEWLVKLCDKMMKDRGESIPSKLYHQLLLEFESEQPMQIFKAFSGEEPLAGICIVSHGSAATYLLGWNGQKGRRLKANQFLLWNAMMLLKEQGVRWFDLGGIDEDRTPGISEFKLGVNGVRYALVGEGWK